MQLVACSFFRMEETKEIRETRTSIAKLLDISGMLSYENVIRNLPFIFFLSFIALAYIGNSHYAVKMVREIDKVNKDIKELRWEYMTAKSELMYQSKQSEVAKLVEPLGLKELVNPPQKIVVKHGD